MKYQRTTSFLVFTCAAFLFLSLGVASGMAADKPNILIQRIPTKSGGGLIKCGKSTSKDAVSIFSAVAC
jgi:hypothetical protein